MIKEEKMCESLLKYLDNFQGRFISKKDFPNKINKWRLHNNKFGGFSNTGFINLLITMLGTTCQKPFSKKHNLDKKNLKYDDFAYWIDVIEKGNLNKSVVGFKLYVYCRHQLYLFSFGSNQVMDTLGEGTKYFNIFKKCCKECGIDLSKYETKNKKEREEIKDNIEPPLLETIQQQYPTGYDYISHVHHIDYHQAYTGVLIEKFPEFKKVVEYINKKYKNHKDRKNIVNMSIGYMQSKEHSDLKYVNIPYTVMLYNKLNLLNLSRSIKKQGGLVLGYNTDGLFYVFKDGREYHGKGEGNEIGEWCNDYTDMKWVPLPGSGVGNASNWMCIDGYYKGKRGFYKALRGNYMYSNIKPYEKWKLKDCIIAQLQKSVALKIDVNLEKGIKINYYYNIDTENVNDVINNMKDITEVVFKEKITL